MGNWKWGIWGFVIAGLLGCNSINDHVMPLHDEVLIYELPFDLTYLRTLEAVQRVPGWELEETDKEKGIIRTRNLEYARFDDADKRMVTLLLNRESRTQTSVRLAPESQRVIGGGEIMSMVASHVSREIR